MPRAAASQTISGCTAGGAAIEMASSSTWSSISRQPPNPSAPSAEAAAVARPPSRPAMATTLQPGS